MMKTKALIATLALIVLGSLSKEAQVAAQDNKVIWNVQVSPKIKGPVNPASKLTPEQRAAKMAELKAKDKIDVDAQGKLTAVSKVLPNLMVLNFNEKVDRYKFTLTDIEGNTLESETGMNIKDMVRCKLDENCGFAELPEGFFGGYDGRIAKFKNGDELEFRVGKISYYKKMYENGDYRLWSSHKTSEGEQVSALLSIRKKLEGGTVEVRNAAAFNEDCMYGFRITYDDGSVFGGKIKMPYTHYKDENNEWEMDRKNYGYMSWQQRNCYCHLVEKATKVSDFAYLNGVLVQKDGTLKVYVNGEYDEIESMTLQKQIQAKIQDQKESEAQAAAEKQKRERFAAKYGKTYSAPIFKFLDGSRISATDLFQVGASVAMYQEAIKEKWIYMSLVLTSTNGASKVYSVHDSFGRRQGWIKTYNGKIVSIHF